MNKEIDQIILITIRNHGIDALPMDNHFLEKYDMKDLYFHYLDLNTMRNSSNRGFINTFKSEIIKSVKQAACMLIDENERFCNLESQYEKNGKQMISSLLYNNELYYKTFKNRIKRNKK